MFQKYEILCITDEANLTSKEVIKSSDHSPARSSVKSFKAGKWKFYY